MQQSSGYLGKVKYKDEVHEGEHKAIIDPGLFDQVKTVLRRNGRGSHVSNRRGALLKGLLYCGPCGHSMSHSYTNKGNRRYRYYVCIGAQKHGWDKCPSKSIPAREIERFVVEEIKCIGQDEGLIANTLAEATAQARDRIQEIKVEQNTLQREIRHNNSETHKLLARLPYCSESENPLTARLADLQERIGAAEKRLTEIREEAVAISREMIDETELAAALAAFDPVWESLSPKEQSRILHLLIERIGWVARGDFSPKAPADPYVRALPHTVPQNHV